MAPLKSGIFRNTVLGASYAIQVESPPKRRTIVVAGRRPRRDTAIGQAMETIPLLKHRRFDPELIESMSAAYTSVCQALGLSTKSDRATETVALKIIEIATRGARSPTAIHLIAMRN
jgi:hypothetical protein